MNKIFSLEKVYDSLSAILPQHSNISEIGMFLEIATNQAAVNVSIEH